VLVRTRQVSAIADETAIVHSDRETKYGGNALHGLDVTVKRS
jgi:hypothetical protein